MSDVPSSIFQPSSLTLNAGFDKFDEKSKGIQSSAPPQAQRKLPAVTPEAASKQYAGPSARPTSAKELYVSNNLATDPEYRRQIAALGKHGTPEQAQAVLAARTAHHSSYYDNVMGADQKAEFANKAIEKGQLEKSEAVNTSRLDPFKAKQDGNYRPPGNTDNLTDQQMANAALAENQSAERIQDRRAAAGLTGGNTPEEIAQNRERLQGLADARTNRGQGANPMIGRVTGAETTSGAGGDVTTTRYSGPTPTADQGTIAAASQAENLAIRERNSTEYQGDRNNKVMSGAAFNAMQDRMATASSPAQHTNDQKVFTSLVRDPNGGASRYKIQGGANNVPGYTTPNTLAGEKSGTINGMPGQQAIAEQKATNEGQAQARAYAENAPAPTRLAEPNQQAKDATAFFGKTVRDLAAAGGNNGPAPASPSAAPQPSAPSTPASDYKGPQPTAGQPSPVNPRNEEISAMPVTKGIIAAGQNATAPIMEAGKKIAESITPTLPSAQVEQFRGAKSSPQAKPDEPPEVWDRYNNKWVNNPKAGKQAEKPLGDRVAKATLDGIQGVGKAVTDPIMAAGKKVADAVLPNPQAQRYTGPQSNQPKLASN